MHKLALVRAPGANLVEGISEFGMGSPDYELALEQHEQYCKVLESSGLELIKMAADPRYPDGCFVEDTAVIADQGAIVTNPGHSARKGEPREIAKVLEPLKDLHYINEPGTVDGGDILKVGNHFFIGLSQRTNSEGASQLGRLLALFGATSSAIEVGESLHLKSGVTCIDANTIICTKRYADNDSFKHIKNRIVVSEEEEHAANCLSVNGNVIVPADCPVAQAALAKLGWRVKPLDLSEFRKLDGAFTCLSLLL